MSNISSGTFSPIKSVQQVSFSGTPNAGNIDVTITAVNTAKAWLVSSGAVQVTTSTGFANVDAYLAASTTARALFDSAAGTNTCNSHSTVVEYNG